MDLNLHPIGPIIRFMRENLNPQISQREIAERINIPSCYITKLELDPSKMSSKYVALFAKGFGIQESCFTILNDSNNYSAEDIATAIYEIFKYVRGQQSEATDIGRVLSLMRIVSGYFDCKKMAVILNEIDEELYTHKGKFSIDGIWQQSDIKRIEIAKQKPTIKQLHSYAILFNVPIDSLTFWLNKRNVTSASDDTKKEIVYYLFSAARNIYNSGFEKTNWELL